MFKNLHPEHIKHLLKRGGIHGKEPHLIDTMRGRLRDLVRARTPWLLIGLIGSLAAAFIVSRFEAILQKNISLAFFIPAIVYIADAVKTQSETLFVRSLALETFSMKRYLAREFIIVFLISILVSVGMFGATILWKQDLLFSATVTFATFINMMFSIATGIGIPWLLMRFGKDPAVGSGPFATVIQDIISVVIYFSIASAILL